MSEQCLRMVRAFGLELSTPSASSSNPQGPGRPLGDDFELWRPRVIAWLFAGAALLLGYWVAWFTDRSLVASAHTSAYITFEQAFPLADAWLAAAAVMAAIQLWRRRPSAFIWLVVVGGAGLYLCALDVLYDLQHGVYASGSGGVIEFGINAITAVSSIGVTRFGWQFRRELLGSPT